MPTSVTLLLGTVIFGTVTVGSILLNLALSLLLRAVFAPKPKTPTQAGLGDLSHTLTFAEPAAEWEIVYGQTRKGGKFVFRHATSTFEDVPKMAQFVIPRTAPYTVRVCPAISYVSDVSVIETVAGGDENQFTKVASSPAASEYTASAGVYTFNAADAGENINITYKQKVASAPHGRLHLVIVQAAHESEEIGDVYFDDEVIPLDADGIATGRLAGGWATIKKHLGANNQTADETLMTEAPTKWRSVHRLRGHTYIYVRLLKNIDLFPTGVPNISTVIKGRKVYDPRTGLTVWSDNAALCIADYLNHPTFGLNAAYTTEIDDDALIAAANVCDEEVLLGNRTTTFTASADTDALTLAANADIPSTGHGVRVSSTGSLPTGLSAGTTYYAIRAAGGTIQLATSLVNARAGTEIDLTSAGSGTLTLTYYSSPRYTCNGIISTAETPQAILEKMLTSLAGRLVYAGGTWRIHAAAYVAPTVTIDEGDLRGAIKVATLLSRRDACNGVKGVFISPDNKWQPADFPPVASDTYMDQDGGDRIWRDIELPFTNDERMAQRIAKIELLRARQQITGEIPCKLTAWNAIPPENLMVTHAHFGWSSKVFELTEAKLVIEENALGVNLVVRETAAAVFDWATNEEAERDPAPDTELPSRFTVERPGAPEIAESLYQTREGGGMKIQATVTWEPSPDQQAYRYILQWKKKTDETWNAERELLGTEYEVTDLRPTLYQFRVRAVNTLGRKSLWSETEYEFQGLAARPASVAGLTLQAMGGMAVLGWDLHSDLDVREGGKILFRHSPALTGATWASATTIGKAAPGNVTTWNLPLKRGTYLAKARDSSGLISVSASSISTKQASIHAFTTVATITE